MDKRIFYALVGMWTLITILVPIMAIVFDSMDILWWWILSGLGGIGIAMMLEDSNWRLE